MMHDAWDQRYHVLAPIYLGVYRINPCNHASDGVVLREFQGLVMLRSDTLTWTRVIEWND